jgi:hypothetical protein
MPLLWSSGAAHAIAHSTGLTPALVTAAAAAVLIAGGALYGRIFMRAANDHRGGWLFGIAFAFLLWMLGPASTISWILQKPLAIGTAAQGILAAHLAYGLILGSLFPWLHRRIQKPSTTPTK